MTTEHYAGRGSLWHTRHRPAHHHFEYPTAMLLVDLDHLSTLFSRRWMGLNRWGVISLRTNRHLYDTTTAGGQAARDAVCAEYP